MKPHLQKSKFIFTSLLVSCLVVQAAPPGNPPSNDRPRQTLTPATLWQEDFTLPNGTKTDTAAASAWTSSINYTHAVFGVYANEFKVNNTSVNGVGVWTSAAISIAGKSNILLSVDLRSGVDPGGSLENDGTAHADYIRCYYKVDGGAEVLFSDLGGNINHNSSTDTTVYSTAAISGSTIQVIVRAKATATDEYYFFDNVTVAGTSACTADASASVSGILTCAADSVQLLGSSATSGATYSWSGPNNFVSGAQNPYIHTAGSYTLVVTAPGGCTAGSTVTVAQNMAFPEGVTANGSNAITCNTPQVNLVGSSTTAGATYSWTGPNGFTAAGAIVPITAGGVYTLKVTNPANGCVKLLPAIVSQNTAPPANVTATNSGPITCTNAQSTLTGSSSTTDAEYEWDGPDGYLSFSAVDIATESGDYTLTVTNPSNGCSTTLTTTIDFECAPSRRITTVSPVADSSAIPGFEWKAYPNPFSETAVITFKSPANDFVTVQVYNNSGVSEKLLFSNRIAPNQSYRLTLSGLPAGVHYVMIRINNKVYTRKLVSLK